MKYFLKKYQTRVANAKISLDQPVIIQTLLGDIKDQSSVECSKSLETFQSLYFWDLGKQASENVEIGDILYIVTQNKIYWGSIAVHVQDPDGGIGDAIGWSRQFKNPWVNPIGLNSINKLSITRQFQAINDSIIKGQRITKSFYQLRSNIVFNEIPNDIPASTAFTQIKYSRSNDIFNHEESKNLSNDAKAILEMAAIPKKSESQLLDSELQTLISQLKLLKTASDHSERQHESLVEKFFVYLGYQYPLDIKYRVRHIDILINPDSQNSMVVEVKSDWGLNKKDKKVVDQAFRYATNAGSRFVVITNGDYYGFYDRLRGLSITENFDFDFMLSEIDDREIQLLKKYNKTSLE